MKNWEKLYINMHKLVGYTREALFGLRITRFMQILQIAKEEGKNWAKF